MRLVQDSGFDEFGSIIHVSGEELASQVSKPSLLSDRGFTDGNHDIALIHRMKLVDDHELRKAEAFELAAVLDRGVYELLPVVLQVVVSCLDIQVGVVVDDAVFSFVILVEGSDTSLHRFTEAFTCAFDCNQFFDLVLC